MHFNGSQATITSVPTALQAAAQDFRKPRIGYYTGARKGEVIDIRWSCVDFAAGRIHLGRTKNGEPRYLPIYGDMKSFLVSLKVTCLPALGGHIATQPHAIHPHCRRLNLYS